MGCSTRLGRPVIALGFVFGLLLLVGGTRPARGEWGEIPGLRETLFPRCVTYARLEYIPMWVTGNRLPPLVTTSPSGTPGVDAGVLGEPGTRVVIGNESVSNRGHQGGRLTFGHWLDTEKTLAIEAQMWGTAIAQDKKLFLGNLIGARPFFNTETGDQDAQIINYPGSLRGGLALDGRNEMYSVDVLARYNCLKGPLGGYVDMIGGYRYFSFRESLDFFEQTGSFVLADNFGTANGFHGMDMGATVGLQRGPWLLDVTAKAAIGGMREKVTIDGFTQLVGVPDSSIPGGWLAAPSNIGRYTHDVFVTIPELDLRLVFVANERIRLSLGYNMTCVSSVVRTGDQIDLVVNPTQLAGLPLARGGGDPSGAVRPEPRFADRSMWMHGITCGAELRW